MSHKSPGKAHKTNCNYLIGR